MIVEGKLEIEIYEELAAQTRPVCELGIGAGPLEAARHVSRGGLAC